MPLIVELLITWTLMSFALGLPLGRAIRRADAREFPLRDSPWWCEVPDDASALDTTRARAIPV